MITQQEILQSEVRALTWKEPFATAMFEGKNSIHFVNQHWAKQSE